ncbi:MAG: hypothetical protein ABIJ20_02835 [Nanoarchaeota archaeon]|nr:hypothetical protein [Nanoarchaeota archaeon]MBU1445243.1 hypothetical protein [Nanoarchaeota archaeon]MBU2420718.1 hypothetical protein [Nanoarchaeota archaeon]MBU2475524.1 hypothetical protein [Nanoarchaeota archaeon]
MKQKIILSIAILSLLSLAVFVSAQDCIDNEAGVDFYKKGSILWNGEKLEDHCGEMQMANQVYEYYCEDDFQQIKAIECSNGCEDGACIKLVPEEEPVELPEDIDEEEEILICQGCPLNKKCYPFGYRKSGNYCSDEQEFIVQKKADFVCDNNFECDSNLCINSECISGSLWTKFMKFLSNLFG